MTRRANFHDYRGPGIYMFTIFRHGEVPALSEVKGNPYSKFATDAPHVELSNIGKILEEEINKTNSMRDREVSVTDYVIMPDHAHIMLRVNENLASPVTRVISGIEAATTSRSRKEGLIGPKMSIFKGTGINDRIVFDKDRLETLVNYIKDNPRRLLLKRMHPDLFRRNLKVRINGETVDCLGNLFLLRRPMIAVHVRRAWDDSSKKQYRDSCVQIADGGIVLISPFIHPIERVIQNAVLERGGCIIKIVDHGFGERFKPTGRLMDTCAEGRLLMISEEGAAEKGEEMSYTKASRLNKLAERIAALSADSQLTFAGGKG